MSAVQLLLLAAAYAPAPLPAALHARPLIHRATLPALVAETTTPEPEDSGGDVLDACLHAPLGSAFETDAETGEPMPDDLVARIRAASTFNQGFATTEYLASALVDRIIPHALRKLEHVGQPRL